MELIFNLEEVVLVVLCDEVDSQSQVAKTSRTTNSVKIGLRVPREVEVDDHVHRHDINTTGEKVGANQATRLSVLEVVIDAVTVRLLHP